MDTGTFSKLTPQELEELKLCGITSPAQLSLTTPRHILEDLEQAESFFPDKTFTLNLSKIQAIYDLYSGETNASTEETSSSSFQVKNVGPTTGFRHGIKHSQEVRIDRAVKKRHQKQILHSPVRSVRPVRHTLAALGILPLIIPAVSIFVLPYLMVSNNLPDVPIALLAAALIILPCLPYLLISRTDTCPVCHIRIFSFRDYSRNRAAHNIPGLGYNLSTALHIIFCRRFTCPGCGTPIKMHGAKGHHKHH